MILFLRLIIIHFISDEVVQTGIELLGGTNTKRADYEVLCTAVEALAEFDEEKFKELIGF